MVLDLSGFFYKHPGGAFLLEYTIGRDISKFFYGGHGLDGNTAKVGAYHPANTHSNIARKIANKHIIAVIGQRDPPMHKYTIDMTKSVVHNVSTKTFAFKIAKEGNQLLEKTGLQNYYSDFETFGKHYTICSYG